MSLNVHVARRHPNLAPPPPPPSHAQQLDLAFNRLRQLPTEIGELAALASLTLDGNRLADVPTQIGQAAALTKLSLRRNQLTRVPMEMSTLVQLTYLALAANKLTECPTVATRMTKLKLLNLDNNSITSCTAFAPRGAAAAEGGEAAAASSTVPDNDTRVLLGRNPVCDSGGAARGMLFGAQWSISCEAVCATGCITGSWDFVFSSCVKCWTTRMMAYAWPMPGRGGETCGMCF